MVFIISVQGKQKLPNKIFARIKSNQCGFCVDSQQGWNDACARVRQNYKHDPNVGMVEIDSAFEHHYTNFLNKDGTQFHLSGYPTHVFIVNNRIMDAFDEERTSDSFEKAIVKYFKLKKNNSRGGKSTRKRRTKRRNTRRISNY